MKSVVALLAEGDQLGEDLVGLVELADVGKRAAEHESGDRLGLKPYGRTCCGMNLAQPGGDFREPLLSIDGACIGEVEVDDETRMVWSSSSEPFPGASGDSLGLLELLCKVKDYAQLDERFDLERQVADLGGDRGGFLEIDDRLAHALQAVAGLCATEQRAATIGIPSREAAESA